MSDTGTTGPAGRRWATASPALAYLALGALFAWNYRHHLSSDAVVYLDIAGYLAGFEFPEAFIGYWGPLLPLLVAPLIAMGVAPVVAGKLVAYGVGLVWVLVFQRFLATRLSAERAALGTLIGAVPCALTIGPVYSVVPDTLLSMAIIGLAVVLVKDARRPAWSLAALAGVLCGVAYLAKTPGWILCAPPTTLCLLRNRMRHGAWTGSFVVSALAAFVGFAAVIGPWVVGLSYRAGRFTIGSASAVALALKHGKLHYDTAGVRMWFPWQGERWVRHTGWAYETTGPVPFHWRYHVDKFVGNLPEMGWFLVLCPLAALGLWRLAVRSPRVLRSTRRAPLWLLSAWTILLLTVTVLERRYLLYVSPLLVLVGMTAPTPAWLHWLARLPRLARMPRQPARRGALLLVCGLVVAASVARYWPRRPLGLARADGAADAVSQLEGGERVWFNRLAAGLPIAFLMDRDLARNAPPRPGAPDPPDPPDVVIWSEVPAAPMTHLPPDRLPGYEPLVSWVEEDGLRVRLFRRR